VVSVKDFVWEKAEAQRNDQRERKARNNWRSEWCPLGEGMVRPDFFTTLQQSNFSGPISQHFEYELGEGPQMIAAMKKELAILKEWLA
jgi:hypothetical protein